VSTLTFAIVGPLRAARRFFLPEALLLCLLLWAPSLAFFRYVAPYTPLLATLAVGTTLAVGWRFRRGRVALGTIVLLVAVVLPMLPPGDARTLGGLVVAVDLALLGLLPDRGILTRTGVLRGLVLALQLAALLVLALLRPGLEPVPAALPVPWPGPVDGVLGILDVVPTATVVAALILAVRSRREGPIHRGLLWGSVAVVAALLGAPGGAGWHAVAASLIAALEDAHRLAYHDSLTGLPSRRSLDEMLERIGGRYTVAMVDVDHFKKFNDRHGHEVGDHVLRMVAGRIRDTPGARAFRYGGEEFTLVFRGKSLADVRYRLDRVRRRIGDAKFVIRAADRPRKRPKRRLFLWRPRQKLRVTASVGAAERTDRKQTPEQVLAKADRALYEAKLEGRNRVVA
jgi:GGDEF domain-containing protein